jgi:hypothetical protein
MKPTICQEAAMSTNKLSLMLGAMFVTGCVFFGLLLKRSNQIREEVQGLRSGRMAA